GEESAGPDADQLLRCGRVTGEGEFGGAWGCRCRAAGGGHLDRGGRDAAAGQRARGERLRARAAGHPAAGDRCPGRVLRVLSSVLLGSAVRAGPDDLHGVADVGKPVFAADSFRPVLHRGIGDLHGAAAVPAHQVVMVVAGAAAVDGFTRIGAEYIHLAGVDQALQRAVHGRQTDSLALLPQQLVQLLSGTEVADLVEELGDCSSLPGGAQAWYARRTLAGGHVLSVSFRLPDAVCGPMVPRERVLSSACATASTTMWARCSSTSRYTTSRPCRSPCTTPADLRTRRCWLMRGCATPRVSTSSCTQRGDTRSCSTIAMRTGAASARSSSPASIRVCWSCSGAGRRSRSGACSCSSAPFRFPAELTRLVSDPGLAAGMASLSRAYVVRMTSTARNRVNHHPTGKVTTVSCVAAALGGCPVPG